MRRTVTTPRSPRRVGSHQPTTRPSAARCSPPRWSIGIAVAAIGALLGFERIDGEGTLLDEGALPQLFTAFRFGLIYGLVAPAAARHRRGDRAVAGRCPFARLPPTRRRRRVDLARRHRARRHLAGRQRWAARRRGGHGRPVPRRPRPRGHRPRRHRPHPGHHRADQPGAGHAARAGAVLLVVGPRHLGGAPRVPAGRARTGHLPVRGSPQRPGHLRWQRRHRRLARFGVDPAGHVPVRHPGRRAAGRTGTGRRRQAGTDADGRLRRAGADRGRRLRRRQPAGSPRRLERRHRIVHRRARPLGAVPRPPPARHADRARAGRPDRQAWGGSPYPAGLRRRWSSPSSGPA